MMLRTQPLYFQRIGIVKMMPFNIFYRTAFITWFADNFSSINCMIKDIMSVYFRNFALHCSSFFHVLSYIGTFIIWMSLQPSFFSNFYKWAFAITAPSRIAAFIVFIWRKLNQKFIIKAFCAGFSFHTLIIQYEMNFVKET